MIFSVGPIIVTLTESVTVLEDSDKLGKGVIRTMIKAKQGKQVLPRSSSLTCRDFGLS